MRYISHLDIMRLFQRTLKRTGIKLKYSEGYSPHPKMSIAQPLSLGYTSRGEYFEFETLDNFAPDDIKNRLNSSMPEGIEMVYCGALKKTKKAMGAIITKGEYFIGVDEISSAEEVRALCDAIAELKNQKEILIEKVQKKTGKIKQIDIRQKIDDVTVIEADSNHVLIKTMVDTGSNSNLNPEQIIVKLKEYMGNMLQTMEFHVQREEMFTESENGDLIPLYLLR